MNAWEFIARISWPAAVIVLAVLFRPLVTSLAKGGLRSLRAGPFELAWEQARSATVSHAEPAKPPSGPRSTSSLIPAGIRDLTESDPRQAIMETYEAVRRLLLEGLRSVGVAIDDDEADALELCRAGERAGALPARVTDSVVGVHVLWNLAVHAPSGEYLRPARAREYIVLAEGAMYAVLIALKAAGARASEQKPPGPIDQAA